MILSISTYTVKQIDIQRLIFFQLFSRHRVYLCRINVPIQTVARFGGASGDKSRDNMKNLEICSYIVVICFLVIPSLVRCGKPVPKNFIVWGPGMAQDAVLPVRYVFIQPVDEYGLKFVEYLLILSGLFITH